jgi:hypothetical protein
LKLTETKINERPLQQAGGSTMNIFGNGFYQTSGAVLLAASLLWVPQADAAAQSKDQQKCLNSMGGYVSRIDTTQIRANQTCVKTYGKGKLETSVADCLVADDRSKMLKLSGKITEAQTDVDRGKCIGAAVPDFGYVATGPAMVAAAQPPQVAFIAAVYGDDPESVIVDSSDRANRSQALCQATIEKSANKIVSSEVKSFKSCMTRGLRSRTAPISDATELAACSSDAKLIERSDKETTKLADQIGKKCTEKSVDWTTVVGGECASEASPTAYSLCIQVKASCAACEIINGGYDLAIDCGSCGAVPSTGGAFVDGPVLF